MSLLDYSKLFSELSLKLKANLKINSLKLTRFSTTSVSRASVACECRNKSFEPFTRLSSP